ncbi:MAG TPA: sigma-70 family RNA polymerase sigma factor [Thermoleophilaceae bacterium]|nr:sigma-70 family RNA polymerase sigma factor [Thermoleophilaceae bacterium]
MFREHHAGVCAYAQRRAPAELAQDAVAETFLVAWRRLDDVPADALPWLYGVARRALANQRRSAARGAALAERIATATPAGGGGDPAEAIGEAEVVRIALGRLSDRDRETLMLVAWDGLSGPRAASAMGCTHTAFKVRLHRARARLARELRALDGRTAERPLADSIEVG